MHVVAERTVQLARQEVEQRLHVVREKLRQAQRWTVRQYESGRVRR